MKRLRSTSGFVCCTGGMVLAFLFLQALGSDIPAESVPASIPGAGVTVIIHGWREQADEPAWTVALQNAITRSIPGGEGHRAKITVTGTKEELAARCDSWNFNLDSSAGSEVIVRVDWSAVANYGASGVTVQQVAAVIAPKLYLGQNGRPPLAQLPLHLIGHSRGAAAAYELARLLGLQGIDVEQVTSLDPHPLTNADMQKLPGSVAIDMPISVSENVLFSDNYWQQIRFPEGQSVPGAYNRLWTSIPGGYQNSGNAIYSASAEHFNIHLMYHGTVDAATPLTDGAAVLGESERGSWYAGAEKKGAQCGFFYSRISGRGNRKSSDTPLPGGNAIIDGYHGNVLLGGTGAREPLEWTAAVWPNILTIHVEHEGITLGRGACRLKAGDKLRITCCCRIPGDGATVRFYLDRDRNPYNGNSFAAVASRDLEPTGSAVAEFSQSFIMPELSSDETYYLCSEIRDNDSLARYGYAVPEFSTEPGDTEEPCLIALTPMVIRGYSGQGRKIRFLLITCSKESVFAEAASPVWEADAIETIRAGVFFDRFILALVRIDFTALDSGPYSFKVGDCEGTILIDKRQAFTAGSTR